MWHRKVVVKRAPVMSSAEIRGELAVDPDAPVLRAVLALLAGLEETERELAGTRGMSAEDRAVTVGRMAMAGEAQERILEVVEEARKRRK
jgi:hypothetical protein